MAETKKKAPPAPEPEVAGGLPPQLTLKRPRSVLVVVVGSGGTGARFAAVLPKMLRRGDAALLLDHDHVEEKNLLRQHFIAPDVGKLKAEVLGRRLAGEAARVNFDLQAMGEKWSLQAQQAAERRAHGRAEAGDLAWHGTNDRYKLGVVIVGCVDNKPVRKEIHDYLQTASTDGRPRIWLDAGNELRAGQVLLTTYNWPVWELKDSHWKVIVTSREDAAARGQGNYVTAPVVRLKGLPDRYPGLVIPDPPKLDDKGNPIPNCEDGPDLQSVTANNLAAAYLGTALSWVLDEIPFSVGGLCFSQLGTVESLPIKEFKRVPGSYVWDAVL